MLKIRLLYRIAYGQHTLILDGPGQALSLGCNVCTIALRAKMF